MMTLVSEGADRARTFELLTKGGDTEGIDREKRQEATVPFFDGGSLWRGEEMKVDRECEDCSFFFAFFLFQEPPIQDMYR
jgi:hypothetical protein